MHPFCDNCGTPTQWPMARCQWCPHPDAHPVSKEELYPHIHAKGGDEVVEEATLSAPTEDELVEQWRKDELIRAGYPEIVARHIAPLKHIDLHQACNLIRRGCEPKLAVRILE